VLIACSTQQHIGQLLKQENNMAKTKVTVIGAGSASFGLNTLGSLMRSKKLRGSEIALVDRNPDTLALVCKLAERLNREWDAQMTVTSFTHHMDALPGTRFVVSAIEVPPRERLWRMDYDITLKYGVRQPYAENGGPGGFAHAARNIMPVLEIAHDMEQACPDAYYINFTNPMVRICDAINRYSKIKVVGLCHQVYAAYGMAGYVLANELGIKLPQRDDFLFSTHADPKYWHDLSEIAHQAVQKIDIKAAGLNHFTWIVDIRDKATGQDLYPLLREGWKKVPAAVEPLTQRVFNAFGLMPVPGDEHLDEYLPWCSDPLTKPWEKYELSLYDWDRAEQGRDRGHDAIRRMGDGQESIDDLKKTDSEGALEVIEAVSGADNLYHLAVNVPNTGQIANLPMNAIVETPAVLTGMGIQPVNMGALPNGVAELLRREIVVGQLCVDSVVEGDRQKALQCLLLDPVITDLDIASQILDDYLTTYKQYLPTFWK
jgi:alpha-galactosidase